MFDQLSAEIVPSLIKGRHNSPNTNNNKAKCITGGTLRELAGKKNLRTKSAQNLNHCSCRRSENHGYSTIFALSDIKLTILLKS
jgi:hypothetical protein